MRPHHNKWRRVNIHMSAPGCHCRLRTNSITYNFVQHFNQVIMIFTRTTGKKESARNLCGGVTSDEDKLYETRKKGIWAMSGRIYHFTRTNRTNLFDATIIILIIMMRQCHRCGRMEHERDVGLLQCKYQNKQRMPIRMNVANKR